MSQTKGAVRADLLFFQEGKCFICHIEEWRTKKRLQLHRIIKGLLGGNYSVDNCILVCTKCHKKAEGLTIERLSGLREQMRMAEVVMPS